MMSYAVKTLVQMQVPFTMKGGSHIPTAGFANINSSGVLLISNGLKQLEISDDHTTVNVGPGNVWNDFYQYLELYGVTVVGGRLGVVSVPGYLLGGGVSFFGQKYRWASANIASFNVSVSLRLLPGEASFTKRNAGEIVC